MVRVCAQEMPGLNGLQTAQQMRDYELHTKPYHRHPIILLTAHIGAGLSALAIASGIDAVMGKPASRGRLLQTLDAVAASLAIANMTAASGATPPSAADTHTVGAGGAASALQTLLGATLGSGNSSPISPQLATATAAAATVGSTGVATAAAAVKPFIPTTSDESSARDSSYSESGSRDRNKLRLSLRRLAVKTARAVLFPPRTLGLIRLWRYQFCLVLCAVNTLLWLVGTTLELHAFGPFPFNATYFAVFSLCWMLFTALVRLTSHRGVLMAAILAIQSLFTLTLTALLHVIPDFTVPFILNIFSGLPWTSGIASMTVVALSALVGIYVRGDTPTTPYTPTVNESMTALAILLYGGCACGGFVVYLMVSRQRNVLALAESRLSTIAAAHEVTEKREASERFLKSLSFDLRTPLNVVLAVAERLSGLKGLAKHMNRRVAIIHSAAHLLLTLVSNMVDVMVMESPATGTAAAATAATSGSSSSIMDGWNSAIPFGFAAAEAARIARRRSHTSSAAAATTSTATAATAAATAATAAEGTPATGTRSDQQGPLTVAAAVTSDIAAAAGGVSVHVNVSTADSGMDGRRAAPTVGSGASSPGVRSAFSTASSALAINRFVEMREMVRHIGRIMVFFAHRKELELAVRVHRDVPRFVEGNQLRLQQALMNIVGNAVKYTDRGQVSLLVDCISAEAFDTMPVFAIREATRLPGGSAAQSLVRSPLQQPENTSPSAPNSTASHTNQSDSNSGPLNSLSSNHIGSSGGAGSVWRVVGATRLVSSESSAQEPVDIESSEDGTCFRSAFVAL